MGLILSGSMDAERIDSALKLWRQGDFALREVLFQTLHHPRESTQPGVEEQADGASESFQGAIPHDGAVLISQTCDVVRGCTQRNKAYLQVAPLVKVTPEDLSEVKRGKRPSFAFVPGAEHLGMVANLELVAIVEKPLLASWERHKGCRSDFEAGTFAQALARHKARYPFPDDFNNHVVKQFQKRAQERHDSRASLSSRDAKERKAALEAAGFRALREIRVAAEPNWDAPEKVVMIPIRECEEDGLTPAQWEELRSSWEALLRPHGVFRMVQVAEPVLLDAISAKEYVESHRLDLDYLSGEEG